jgi:hypothetical protein
VLQLEPFSIAEPPHDLAKKVIAAQEAVNLNHKDTTGTKDHKGRLFVDLCALGALVV